MSSKDRQEIFVFILIFVLCGSSSNASTETPEAFLLSQLDVSVASKKDLSQLINEIQQRRQSLTIDDTMALSLLLSVHLVSLEMYLKEGSKTYTSFRPSTLQLVNSVMNNYCKLHHSYFSSSFNEALNRLSSVVQVSSFPCFLIVSKPYYPFRKFLLMIP
jgi:hypothetical protein